MLQILLLGTPQIILDGKPIRELTSAKSQALLYYLAVSGRPEARLTLAGLLWPEKSDQEARTNLRQAVRQLRQFIGDADAGGYLVTTRETLSLHETLPLEVDATIFEWMANAGMGGQIPVLQFALDRYTGEFLNGFFLDDAYGFEEWMLIIRERLRSLAIHGLQALAQHYAEQTDIKKGLTTARRLLEIEPWREETHRLMMQFLAWDGQTSAALTQFERCRQLLWDELGVKPGADTLTLYEAIRANQIPRKTFPIGEPKTQPVPVTNPNNLPPHPTRFIGRTRELTEVKQLLSTPSTDDKKPLVTLFGMGGVGKTRLALQAGTDLLPYFPDGVWLIELASILDPALVPQAIVSALGLHEGAERPPLDIIQAHFYSRTALVILDNCEQVIAACAAIATTLREQCPNLTLLTTSREALRVPGEKVYPVPAMETPDPQHLPSFEQLLQWDSVELFVERALASWPAFPYTPATATAIAEICRKLDGIPLAIELAAVRVNALSVEKIAERLTHRFQLLTRGGRTALPRHQTLLALVDWSYDLLDQYERALLQRLSVFSGGWTLEAAEAICAEDPGGDAYALDIHPMDVLDLLTRLADKSLVQIPEIHGEHTRYRLLETIRQYAGIKLKASGEARVVSEKHGRFFLHLVITANPRLRSPAQKEWTTRLQTEQENIRAALTWWLETDPVHAVQMAGLMGRYWDRQGFYTEGRETLAKALAVAPEAPIPYQIKALKWASGLAMRQANYKKGAAQAEAGLALSREQDDKVHMAAFLNILGLIASGEGHDRAAQQYVEESVQVQRALGNPWGIASGLDNLGNITRALGDVPKALEYMLECLEITRGLGDQHLMAHNLLGTAECYIDLHELDIAKRYLSEASRIQEELGDRQGMAYALGFQGIIAWLEKDDALTQTLFQKSLALRREIGDRTGEGYVLGLLGLNAWSHGNYSLAEKYVREGITILIPLGDKRNIINGLELMGHIVYCLGDAPRAVKLWAACQTWRAQAGTPVRGFFRPLHEAQIAQAFQALGEEVFSAFWQEGATMTIEQVLDHLGL